MNKSFLLLLSILALPVMADNNKGFYFGLGWSGVKHKIDGDDTTRVKMGEIIGGYKYNAALGAEIRVGNSLSDSAGADYIDAAGMAHLGTYSRTISSYKSIYYRPELSNEEAKLYGLFGYSSFDSSLKVVDATASPITTVKSSFSGLSYGVGVGFVVSDNVNINFEYKSIAKSFNTELDTISVNVDYRF